MSLANYEYIEAPERISIYDFKKAADLYSQTIDFINEIKKTVGRKECVLDFRNTHQITTAAIIVIYATVEDAINIGLADAKLRMPVNSPIVSAQLRHIGLHKLVKRKNIHYQFGQYNVLPVISGTGTTYTEEIVDYIRDSIYKHMDAETEQYYGSAVVETIENVSEHAYPAIPEIDKKWWIMCEVKKGQLFLAIYDRGIGIPKAVTSQPWYESSLKSTYQTEYIQAIADTSGPGADKNWVNVLTGRLSSEQLIYLSMMGSVSSTRESKRGQGSKSIKALVQNTENGKLWVFSQKGLLKYSNGVPVPKTYALQHAFPGTLLQWNIKIT